MRTIRLHVLLTVEVESGTRREDVCLGLRQRLLRVIEAGRLDALTVAVQADRVEVTAYAEYEEE